MQAEACKFNKNKTPPGVFFTFYRLYQWYQIAQSITSVRQNAGSLVTIYPGTLQESSSYDRGNKRTTGRLTFKFLKSCSNNLPSKLKYYILFATLKISLFFKLQLQQLQMQLQLNIFCIFNFLNLFLKSRACHSNKSTCPSKWKYSLYTIKYLINFVIIYKNENIFSM